MKPSLPSGISKTIFAVVLLGAVALYVGVAWRHYSAATGAAQDSISAIENACNLEPSNAECWQSLGAQQLAAFDSDQARDSLLKASSLNPWDARTWLMLATIHQIDGDENGLKSALDAAYSADPKTPAVAWRVGNFYMIKGQTSQALQLFRTVLQNGNSDDMTDAFRVAWQATHDANALLTNMVVSPRQQINFLGFLTDHGEADAAATVWKRIQSAGRPVPTDSSKYIDFLVSKHDVVAAELVWEDMVRLNHIDRAQRGDNLVVNGDFEEPISGNGFDWHYTPNSSCSVNIDMFEGKSGTRSLSVQFMGGGTEDAGISQYIPVLPNTHYELTAFIKSRDIESSSGPRLAILDYYTGQQYGVTDDILGSNIWREDVLPFTTGPRTELIVIKILRTPANPGIKGTLWLDDVHLAKR